MGGIIILTQGIITSLPLLFVNAFIAGAIYFAIIFILGKNELIKTVSFVASSMRSK